MAYRKRRLVIATSIASLLYLLFCCKNNTLNHHAYHTKHKNQIYNMINTNDEHSEEMFEEIKYPDLENFLVRTPGCTIPNYGLKMNYSTATGKAKRCGKRAVFIQKIFDGQVIFLINADELKKRIKNKLFSEHYRCCYMFARRSESKGLEDTTISYTYCETFANGSIREHVSEVIKVRCVIDVFTIIYEDSYILLKKVSRKNDNTKINATKWNVIILGIDSMSRARLFAKMPKLGAYLRMNNWLDYRGYNTVGRNTYPNLISLLTGMKLSTMEQACLPDMFPCNKYFIWSRFREAGYVTAYGEDYLSLTDTSHPWKGFSSIPTDHYLWPLFHAEEKKKGIKLRVVCTKQRSSGRHIISYAQDFADTYRDDSYFGFFWTNSFTHNLENQPRLFENDVLKLLLTLTNNKNTFIVLLGDHGIQLGPDRLQMESYYDYRLPMLFVWTPKNFIKERMKKYRNLLINQRRLISPYDMHLTLLKLSNMSANKWKKRSEGCPTCHPLFKEVSPHRTCRAAGIGELYCSCHQLATTDIREWDTQRSLKVVVQYAVKKSETVATLKCWKCIPLVLSKVLRAHTFTDFKNSTKYFVLAWEMQPRGLKYEVTVRKDDDRFTIVNDSSGMDIVPLISYDVYGYCTKAAKDKIWCACENTCSSKLIQKAKAVKSSILSRILFSLH